MSTYDEVVAAIPDLIELCDCGALLGATRTKWRQGNIVFSIAAVKPVQPYEVSHIRAWLNAIRGGKARGVLPTAALYFLMDNGVQAWITHDSKEHICAEN